MDETYEWDEVKNADGFRRITLFGSETAQGPAHQVIRRIHATLDELKPEIVAVPGWSAREALAALGWCRLHEQPAIIMSASTVYDDRRTWWKEAIKRRVVGMCSAGLVGGQPHREYMVSLGMSSEHIFTGYDVVDNDHFAQGADAARTAAEQARASLGLPQPFFLACARFVHKKNLDRLMEAYALYRRRAGQSAWHLVILGDGKLRAALENQRDSLSLPGRVHLPGFKQYDELPSWYGLASTFILASIAEQWGLVVNEAMASGLPVLVSNRCGCAPDLVEEGANGFTFDPNQIESLADLMLEMSGGGSDLHAMGQASRAIISHWTPGTFATRLMQAVQVARMHGHDRGLIDGAILQILQHR
jgi:1,2-diacylglycerol 3-alpha-glucosyltransferase